MNTQPHLPFYFKKDAKQILVKRTSSMSPYESHTWQKHIPVMPLVSIDTPYDDTYNKTKTPWHYDDDYDKTKTPWHYITQDSSDTPQAYKDATEGKGGFHAIDSIIEQYKKIISQLDGVEEVLKKEVELSRDKNFKIFKKLKTTEKELDELEREVYKKNGTFSYDREMIDQLELLIYYLKKQDNKTLDAYNKAFNDHLWFTERIPYPEDNYHTDCAAYILKHAKKIVANQEEYKANWLDEVCKTYDAFLDSQGWEDGTIVNASEYEKWWLDVLNDEQSQFTGKLTRF